VQSFSLIENSCFHLGCDGPERSDICDILLRLDSALFVPTVVVSARRFLEFVHKMTMEIMIVKKDVQ
jgi:hypothetical protein